jgi:hypothetical protein
MRRRNIDMIEQLYEQYMLHRKPAEGNMLPRLITMLPAASVAMLAATVTYILTN